MTNEDEEHGDLPFHLAWRVTLQKELNNSDTYSERLVLRKEMREVRETIRKLEKQEDEQWEN
jgi:hypothetical protein